MKKTMIYLPEEAHEGLRKLAFEKHVSIAELIRLAIDSVYGEDIKDTAAIHEAVAEYEAKPAEAISLNAYLKERAERRERPPLPHGALTLVGVWGNVRDKEMDSLIEDIYATREKDTGRPVELDA
jgi:hypothetical protein